MQDIIVKDLTKIYTTHKRDAGFLPAVKALFKREKVTVRAVDGISFTICAGEIVGLLGRNGAGKSTTIKMLTGVLTPTSGLIDAFGYDPAKQRTRYTARIGAVFGQKSQLIWDIPPLDAFHMNKAIYGIPKENFKATLERLVELLDAGEIITRPTRSLSLGERMKCEFIMAMLHNPQVVFLDEPTIGLDIIARESIREFIRAMNRGGTTFILTTHDLADIEELAQRVMIIDKGKLVYEDTLDSLRHHLGSQKTVNLTASAPLTEDMFAADGVAVSRCDDTLRLTVDTGIMPMNRFLSWVSERCDITDLSITEMPIEEIVKTIYEG